MYMYQEIWVILEFLVSLWMEAQLVSGFKDAGIHNYMVNKKVIPTAAYQVLHMLSYRGEGGGDRNHGWGE